MITQDDIDHFEEDNIPYATENWEVMTLLPSEIAAHADHMNTIGNFEYYIIEDKDDDVVKFTHHLWNNLAMALISPDFTPYDFMRTEDLKLYIALRCPTRVTKGPLNRKDLIALYMQNGNISSEDDIITALLKDQ